MVCVPLMLVFDIDAREYTLHPVFQIVCSCFVLLFVAFTNYNLFVHVFVCQSQCDQSTEVVFRGCGQYECLIINI